MEYFKDLYEQVIESTFSGKLNRMLYENELTEKPLSSENVDAFRNLFQRYKDLRKLGDEEFVEVGFRDRMDAINECGASNDSEKQDEKPVPNPMTFYIHNRDSAIEFIDKLKKIINSVGYVTVYQACVLLDRLEDLPYNRHRKATVFDDCLLGWDDLSSIVDSDGSYDSSIIEDYYPCYQCSVRLPAPKYLTEEQKEES